MSSLDGFTRWIRRCNTENYRNQLLPLVCGGRQVGFCKPSFAQYLARYPKVFQVDDQAVSVLQELDTAEKRTSALADIMQQLRGDGVITGWRDELYPVSENFHSEPCFLLERAAAVPFGIKSYGVHMNGYVESSSGLKLWVARRAKNKPTWPGKLDHMCAGGQPYGISPRENMIKECAEEASIPEHIARNVLPVGAVSYAQIQAHKIRTSLRSLQEGGLKRDCLFCYDLRLPADFQPTPGDAEVESFELMDIARVVDIISSSDHFKDNCNLVIMDFLVRHGVLTPENPGYPQLVAGLRQEDCT